MPLLLDLFCKAGGAGMGYHRAGFDVVGVDIEPQPNYPFEFVQADAMTFDLRGFDVVHASPPCQRYSSITATSGNPDSHPDLIEPIRERLKRSGVMYVIENVPRSPLIDPVLLCGVRFGIRLGKYVLRRHRLFESNVKLAAEGSGCGCYRGDGVTMGVYGGGTSTKEHNPNTKGGRPYKGTAVERIAIMGMPWASAKEVNQAIPPAYTEWIGRQLLEA